MGASFSASLSRELPGPRVPGFQNVRDMVEERKQEGAAGVCNKRLDP